MLGQQVRAEPGLVWLQRAEAPSSNTWAELLRSRDQVDRERRRRLVTASDHNRVSLKIDLGGG